MPEPPEMRGVVGGGATGSETKVLDAPKATMVLRARACANRVVRNGESEFGIHALRL